MDQLNCKALTRSQRFVESTSIFVCKAYFLGSVVDRTTLLRNECLSNVWSPLWLHRDAVDTIFQDQDDNLDNRDENHVVQGNLPWIFTFLKIQLKLYHKHHCQAVFQTISRNLLTSFPCLCNLAARTAIVALQAIVYPSTTTIVRLGNRVLCMLSLDQPLSNCCINILSLLSFYIIFTYTSYVTRTVMSKRKVKIET